MINDLSIEKCVLAGLLHNPHLIAEKSDILSESLFTDEDGVYATIYKIMHQLYSDQKELDVHVIISMLRSYGVKFKRMNDTAMADHIETLKHVKPQKKITIENIERLNAFRISNIIISNAEDIKMYVKKNANTEDIEKLIENVDSIYGKTGNLYRPTEDPVLITNNLWEAIEARMNEPEEVAGLKGPYKEFNDHFGGYMNGEVYAFVARPKQGKSTLLSSLGMGIAAINKCKVLYLDTEMRTEYMQFRSAAGYSGVNMAKIQTGNINEDEKTAIKKSIEKMKSHLDKYFYHKHCPNMPTNQIINLTKRWILQNIKEGEKFAVIYDYMKMTGDKTSDHNKEYQIIGEKVEKLKGLAEEYNFPLLTSCQMNRSGEKEGNDDGAAIALSDRLSWYATFVAIFRRKRVEEIEQYGDVFGSHVLIPLYTRFQGEKAKGHEMVTLMPLKDSRTNRKNKRVNFFINFHVDNFRVKEMGTSDDIADSLRENYSFKEMSEESDKSENADI